MNDMNKIDLSGLKRFALSCAYFVGSLGGVLVCVADGYWPIGICVAAVAVLAAPAIHDLWHPTSRS